MSDYLDRTFIELLERAEKQRAEFIEILARAERERLEGLKRIFCSSPCPPANEPAEGKGKG